MGGGGVIEYVWTETVFKEKHGVWDPMLEMTITHLTVSHGQFRSQLSTRTTKGKGVEWGRSLLLIEHVCICLLISKTTHRKK